MTTRTAGPKADLRAEFRALFSRDVDWIARILLAAAAAADSSATYFSDVVIPARGGKVRQAVDRERIEAMDEVRSLCRLAAAHLCRAAGVPRPADSPAGDFGDVLRELADLNDSICLDQDALDAAWRAALGKGD